MGDLHDAVSLFHISWKYFSQETRLINLPSWATLRCLSELLLHGSDGAKLLKRTWRSTRFLTPASFLRTYVPHRLLFPSFLWLCVAHNLYENGFWLAFNSFALFLSVCSFLPLISPSFSLLSRNTFYLYMLPTSLCICHYRFAFSSLSWI